MSEEIKELLFLLYNDRLTEPGKRKLEQEVERLNKELEIEEDISNGMLETIDKAIKYIEEAQERDEDKESCSLYVPKLLEILRCDENGNYEVEIIEDKKIEKLDIRNEKNCKNNWKWKVYGEEHSYNVSTPQKIIADKINEIIDYINKGE